MGSVPGCMSFQNTLGPGSASNSNVRNLIGPADDAHTKYIEICCTLFRPKTEEVTAAQYTKPTHFQANENNTSSEEYYIERFVALSHSCRVSFNIVPCILVDLGFLELEGNPAIRPIRDLQTHQMLKYISQIKQSWGVSLRQVLGFQHHATVLPA